MNPSMTRRETLGAAAVIAAGLALPGSAYADPSMMRTPPATIPTPQPTIVAYSPHPDDETLSMGALLATEGVDDWREARTIVVPITAGEASGARRMLNGVERSDWWGGTHEPRWEGYYPLMRHEFGEARLVEQHRAATLLGAYAAPCAGLPDGGVTIGDAQLIIARWVWRYPYALHITTSPWDLHPDHRACAAALRAVAPTRARWCITPVYHRPLPADLTDTRDTTFRARHAAISYAAWNPPDSYAIGAHSIGGTWNRLLNHTPTTRWIAVPR